MSLATAFVQAGHLASLWPAARRYHEACRDPERAQLAKLRELISGSTNSDFGREHRFANTASLSEFQKRVPVRDYEDFRPWLDRMAQGETELLTSQPVIALEPTSGSTQANKLIPYTSRLLSEFSAATAPWIFDILSHHRSLFGKTSYWSVSAATQVAPRAIGGIRVGLEDDTEYFGPLQRWAIRRTLAIPAQVGRIVDTNRWRRATALGLLAAENLGFISVWHPSFLTLLVEHIEEHWEELLQQLPHFRCQQLRLRRGRTQLLTSQILWPRLQLISCWIDGPAAPFLRELRRRCPTVALQGKGLMATEGVVSLPLTDQIAPAAAITSHFLEFIDLASPSSTPLLAHQLRQGGDYRPLLTTGGGLFRYDLGDSVTCQGHYRRTPLLSFEGRLDQRSDLCGEKLDAAYVDNLLAEAYRQCEITPKFSMLAPSLGRPPNYTLYVESEPCVASQLRNLEDEVESRLREGHHYALCRKTGQLGAVTVQSITNGVRCYRQACLSRGMKEGNIKPTQLSCETNWSELFQHQNLVV